MIAKISILEDILSIMKQMKMIKMKAMIKIRKK